MVKRLLAAILAAGVFLSALPLTAFGETPQDQQIRQELYASVDAEEYPQGMFDFLTARMETSEDLSSVEFAVVRRGNTDSQGSVTLKAIDMTAQYGKDYVIKVQEGLFAQTLPENPDAVPMVEQQIEASQSTHTVTDDSFTQDEEKDTSSSAETSPEEPPAPSQEDSAGEKNTSEEGNLSSEDNTSEDSTSSEASNLSFADDASLDLADARTALTGLPSSDANWQQEDLETVELLSESYNAMYQEIPGVTVTLDFAPGEYMKKLTFETIDDAISEDEEQVLLVLTDPVNGAVSQNPTGFFNIKDNEEPEEITYSFDTDVISVLPTEDSAVLTIRRDTGLYRYGTAQLSSASGSAESGEYYDDFVTEAAFVPGQQYKTIEIPILKHPLTETLSFTVRIENSSHSLLVQLLPQIETVEDSLENQETLQNSAVKSASLLGANDNLWSRSVLIKEDAHRNDQGENDWYKFVINNSKNTTKQQDFPNLDLSMVGKFSLDSIMLDRYTTTGAWFWKKYHRGWTQWLKVNGSTLWSSSTSHNWANTGLLNLPENQRKENATLTIGGSTTGKCGNAQFEFGSVKLYYQPIEIRLGKYDDDALIQEKIYYSQNNTKNDGAAYKAGTLKFAGESSTTTSKFFYNTDTVNLEGVFDSGLTEEQKESIYLWGFKLETKAGASPKFYYVKGTQFSIKDLYTGKLKDSISGLTIGSTAKLSHTINGETFPCYEIYPVYKQKTAYTTMKIDESKARFATGTFKNEETVKTGRLDSIQYNLTGVGDYTVSGYTYTRDNRNGYSQTPADLERTMFGENIKTAVNIYKTWSPMYKVNSSWQCSLENAGVSQPSSYLFTPQKTDNALEALYAKPEINVAVHPRSSSAADQEKGKVVYIPGSGEPTENQVAQYTGKDQNGYLRGDEISVAPFKVGDTYQFMAQYNDDETTGETSRKYKIQWQDMSGDINRDGILDKDEIEALGDSYALINKGVYAGDVLYFSPQVALNPLLYFTIVPKSQKDTDFVNRLSGSVNIETCSVIENSKPNPKKDTVPLKDATVTAGGYTAQTDENGEWLIESKDFDIGETYFITAAYGNRSYTSEATVNRFANQFSIDAYNTFNVKNFNAYRVTNDSEYDNIEDWQLHPLSVQAISNEDKRHLYTFEIDELLPNTATVGHVEVYRYSSGGTLKDTYTAVYNEENGTYEIKDPALIEANKNNPSAYNYSFNPATENVTPGDTLSIRVFDQNGTGYIAHDVGFVFKPKLSVINIVNSFKSPFNDVVEFIGDMDMSFDLGLTAGMDKLDNKLSDKVEEKLDVETTDTQRTISFGWSTDFTKTYDSTKEEEGEDKKDQPATVNDKVKEEAGKVDQLEQKTDDEKTEAEKKKDDAIKKEASETAKNAVDKNDKDTEKKGSVTSELKVNLSVAVSLVMGYDQEENRYYFDDFVVTGIIDGVASAKQMYTTPIGITLFAQEELTGNITGILAMEPYYPDPTDPKYLYMDEAGSIDLTKLGNSDIDRELSIYGKLMIQPKITLSAGAAAYSDKIASVTLNGIADFDMMFTTAGNGIGDVTLSANLVLDILGGVVKKKWDIVEKKYNMFNINGTEKRALLADGSDYRYDVVTEEDTDPRLYLENRTQWNEAPVSTLRRAATGAQPYTEHVLQGGVYPYAYPQIITISQGYRVDGTESTQLLTFLDSEEDGITLKYSIYEDGIWAQPQPIDDDGNNDDTPRVYDLGDTILVTWSSEGDLPDDATVIDRLNSRNIKSVFFDKKTMTFGPVQFVTKTTEQDVSSDDHGSVSFYEGENGEKQLVLSYIKSQYKQSEEEDVLVGDLLYPYSTIAYRLYDFETGAWVETYSEDTMTRLSARLSREDAETFAANWYGQNFMDLSAYVYVNEADLLIPQREDSQKPPTAEEANDPTYGYEGLWEREPTVSEISLMSLSTDPLVVEHESDCCGKYGVSVYLLDLDKDTETLNDQEIFLQLYDFETSQFYPLIRLTNDDLPQSYLTLSDTPEGLSLYYIDNGNIAQLNLEELFASSLQKATVNGEELLYNSRQYQVFTDPETILEAEENDPFTEFIVNAQENNVFLSWTENDLSFKDGIDRNSPEATDPDNYLTQRHLKMAMESFRITEVPLEDENGKPQSYPKLDNTDKVIDYTTTPDINGELGKVQAGDPIIEHVMETSWSDPVLLSDEEGVHINDFDCVIHDTGIIRAVYLKGMSRVTEISGEEMPAENTDNRSLVTADFNLDTAGYTVSLEEPAYAAAGQEDTPVYAEVQNRSVLSMSKTEVELYQTVDGKKEMIGSAVIDQMDGGETATVMIPWDTPPSLEGVTLEAQVTDGFTLYASDSCTLSSRAAVEITDATHTMQDRNTAILSVTVKNTGTETAENEKVSIHAGESSVESQPFTLLPGEVENVSVTTNVPESLFADASTENQVAQQADLTLSTVNSVVEYPIFRTAPKSWLSFLEGDISLYRDDAQEPFVNGFTLSSGKTAKITAQITSGDTVTAADVVLSSTSGALSLYGNVILAERGGTAGLTIQAVPGSTAFLASDRMGEGATQKENLYNTLPAQLIRTIPLTVTVPGGTTIHTVSFDTAGGAPVGSVSVESGKTLSRPADPEKEGFRFIGWYIDPACTMPYLFSSPVTSSFTLYAGWQEVTTWENTFTDITEDQWFYENIQFVCENGLFAGVSETSFAPYSTMTRAMFAQVLYRAENEPELSPDEENGAFQDVLPGKWYTDGVYWAQNAGIIEGYSESTFGTNDPITREQMAVMLYRYFRYKYGDEILDQLPQLSYTDAEDISAWAKEAIAFCQQEGIMLGNSNGTFRPGKNSIRAEAAAVLQRFLEHSGF